MENNFTIEELDLLIESMIYSKKKFEEYPYENEEFRKKRIDQCEQLISKIRILKK